MKMEILSCALWPDKWPETFEEWRSFSPGFVMSIIWRPYGDALKVVAQLGLVGEFGEYAEGVVWIISTLM